MDDLVAFLRARLDEDEAAAKDERVWFGPHPETIGEHEGWLVIQEGRVLLEVDAKRPLLDLYVTATEHDDASLGVTTLRLVLKTFAAVYSDHPDYRPEWKP